MAECRVVVLEDDAAMGESMLARFGLEGWSTCLFKSCCQAELHWPCLLEADVIISDLRLPDGNGGEMFARYQERGGSAPFILVTAYASLPDAIELMRNGLNDYWTKPFDIEEAVSKLSELLNDEPEDNEPELGHCHAMREVERSLKKVASRNINVLITGETGTGKEEAVRFMHKIAGGTRPLVTVNCAAIPRELLESELFGHEKGAFTGAISRKIGCIERAAGGTLFLDEIGDMPLDMQVKILRVIQNKSFMRVGSAEETQVDFRLVCATHRNLQQMIAQGSFREDLYYRINVHHVHLPPLRERNADVLWLAMKFIEQSSDNPAGVRGLTPMAEQFLLTHPFPGNVRELKNRIERGIVMAESRMLDVDDLFIDQRGASDATGRRRAASTLKELVHMTEKRALEQALEESEGVVSQAARTLGISRKTLWEKARKLGVNLH